MEIEKIVHKQNDEISKIKEQIAVIGTNYNHLSSKLDEILQITKEFKLSSYRVETIQASVERLEKLINDKTDFKKITKYWMAFVTFCMSVGLFLIHIAHRLPPP